MGVVAGKALTLSSPTRLLGWCRTQESWCSLSGDGRPGGTSQSLVGAGLAPSLMREPSLSEVPVGDGNRSDLRQHGHAPCAQWDLLCQCRFSDLDRLVCAALVGRPRYALVLFLRPFSLRGTLALTSL